MRSFPLLMVMVNIALFIILELNLLLSRLTG